MITRKKRLHMILVALVVMIAMGVSSMLLTIRPAASEDSAMDASILQDLNEENSQKAPAVILTAHEAGRGFQESAAPESGQKAAEENQLTFGEVTGARDELLEAAGTMEEGQQETEEELPEEGLTGEELPDDGQEWEEPEEDWTEDEEESNYEDPYEEESYYEEPWEEESSYDEPYEEESSYEEPWEEESSEVPEEIPEESESSSEPEPEPSESSSEPEPSEEESSEEEPEPQITSSGYSDLDYLAAICQIEAGYNYDGCLAVANVVLNRVKAGFAPTIYDVIYAPYQFATYNMDYWLKNGTSEAARQAAQDALNGVNNVGDYLFFNGETWLDPSTLTVPYVVIGGNVFY